MENCKESHFKEYGCTNVLHIGGHRGQEAGVYESLGLRFTFVEPNPKYAAILREKGYPTIEAAVSSLMGKTTFHLHPESSELSSLKVEKGVAPASSFEVECMTLGQVQHEGDFDALSVDAQGETYDIIAYGDLSRFKVIICETSQKPRYEGEKSAHHIAALLKLEGFTQKHVYPHGSKDVADEVWIREQ